MAGRHFTVLVTVDRQEPWTADELRHLLRMNMPLGGGITVEEVYETTEEDKRVEMPRHPFVGAEGVQYTCLRYQCGDLRSDPVHDVQPGAGAEYGMEAERG